MGGHHSGLGTRQGPCSQGADVPESIAHLTVNHIGDHHNLVGLSIRKLEGQFGCLNVKRQNHRILEGHDVALRWPLVKLSSGDPGGPRDTHHQRLYLQLLKARVEQPRGKVPKKVGQVSWG